MSKARAKKASPKGAKRAKKVEKARVKAVKRAVTAKRPHGRKKVAAPKKAARRMPAKPAGKLVAKASPKVSKRASALGLAAARRAPKSASPKSGGRGARGTIERELLLGTNPEAAYRLFATSEGITSWFATGAEVDARPGGRFDLQFGGAEYSSEGSAGCSGPVKISGEVTAAEPGKRFAFRWNRTPVGSSAPSDQGDVVVTFAQEVRDTLSIAGATFTRIRLVESGFGPGSSGEKSYLENSNGWTYELAKMFPVLEGIGARGRTASISQHVDAKPAEVFEAIGSADGLARWFASGGKLEARAGGRYALDAGPSKIEGDVRGFVPGQSIALTWTLEPCTGKTLPAPTLVSLSVAPEGTGSKMTLVHSGFGGGPEWEGIYERHVEGWTWLVSNLRSVLERGIDLRTARTLERELFLRLPPAKVWPLLATKEGVERWLALRADLDLRAGGRYDLVMDACDGAGGEWPAKNAIVSVEPEKRLALEWETAAEWAGTTVELRLEAEGSGTRLSLCQSGFGDGSDWDEWYASFEGGWADLLSKLFAVAEGIGAGGRSISMTKRLEASPERVWSAIASGDGLKSWWVDDAEIAPEVGKTVRLRCTTDFTGEVREAREGRALAFTWSGCPGGHELPAPTLASFSVSPEKGGARVTLVHSGFGTGDAWDELYEMHKSGWTYYMANLASVLDHGLDRRQEGRSIVRMLHIDAPPARVYRALTERRDLEQWECKSASIDPREGGRFRFAWSEALAAEGAVLAAEPGKSLELAYRVPSFAAGTHPTLVAFTIAAEGGGARLTLVHSGFEQDASWDEYYRGHRECWDLDLEELATLCERGAPGKVLRLELTVPEAREADALEAFVAAAGGREIAHESGPEGSGVVLAEPSGSRVRAREERVGAEMRLVVTEAFPSTVEAEPRYAGWKERLSSAFGSVPVQCGTMFES